MVWGLGGGKKKQIWRENFSWTRKGFSHQCLALEDQGRSQTIPHGICGWKSVIRTTFFLKVLYISPVIIPPQLHTHLFIHPWHYAFLVLANNSVLKWNTHEKGDVSSPFIV